MFTALLLVSSAQAFGYSGTLTSADGGLVGTGSWVDKSLLKAADQPNWTAPVFSWLVTENADLTWHYHYTLTVYKKDISHMTVEASPTFGASNIFNSTWPAAKIEIADFTSQQGSPNMPGSIHGIKFDETIGTTVHVAFDSDRLPVWGDLYAKDGTAGGGIWNTVWNAGFTNPDSDPVGPPANGPFDYHILVPDTSGPPPPPVPEPASLVTLSLGIGMLMIKRGNLRR